MCVRHRLSDDGLTRHTTVELLIESLPVQTRDREIIAIRPPPLTQDRRAHLIANGAEWHPRKRYWLLPRLVARLLGLVRHRVSL